MSCCDKKCPEDQQNTECKMRQKINELPDQQKIKAIALFQLYQKKVKSDEQMDKEVSAIEMKYQAQTLPLLKEQHQIICGDRAPTVNELEKLDEVLKEDEKPKKDELISNVQAKRIDGYWVKVFENCEVLKEEMKQKDKPVLKHLNKIELKKFQDSEDFEFTFEFQENEYFNNSVLTKKFYMKDASTPIRSEASEIQWKEGKDLTKKTIEKKQKNKKTGQTRTVKKTVKDESFFNFFNSIDVTEDHLNTLDDEEADEQQENMDVDLEIAQLLDEEAIQYSIEYYLDIAKGEYDDEDMEDGDDDDDDDDDDSEEDEKPKKKNKRKSSDKKSQEGDVKPECKQQ